MHKYPEKAVRDAAEYAYKHSPAGINGDTEYVERKTQQFVERCKSCNFGREVDDDGNISRAAIEQIAYSALSDGTERMLWQYLHIAEI